MFGEAGKVFGNLTSATVHRISVTPINKLRSDETAMNRFYHFIHDRSLSLAFASFVLAMLCAYGLTQLQFHSGFKVFFDPGDSNYEAYEKRLEQFNGTDSLIVFISVDQGHLLSTEGLDVLREITDKAESESFVWRVDSLVTLPTLTSDEGDVELNNLIDELESDETLTTLGLFHEELKQQLTNHPIFNNSILSQDGKISAIQIVLDSETVNAEAIDTGIWLDTLVKEARTSYPDFEFHYIGDRIIEKNMLETSVRDAVQVWPWVGVFGILIIAVALRNIFALAAAGTLIFFVLLSNLGATGLVKITLDQTSLMALPVVFLCSIANSIHVMSSFLKLLRNGESQRNAFFKTYENNTKAIILSAVTTMLGFYALNTTGSPVFKAMGNIVAIGVLINLIFTFTLLPAFMLKLPFKSQIMLRESVFQKSLNKIGHLSYTYRYIISLTLLVLSTLVFVTFPLTTFNDAAPKYFHKSLEVRQTIDFLENRWNGINHIDISIPLNNSDADEISSEITPKVKELQEWLKTLPEVQRTESIADWFQLWHQAAISPTPLDSVIDTNHISEHRESVFELGNELGLVAKDGSALLLKVNLQALDNARYLELVEKIRSEASDILSLPPEQISVSSQSYLFSKLAHTVILDTIAGILGVLVLATLILSIGFNSTKLGFLSIIPNIMPGIFVYAGLAYLGLDFNMPVAVTFCVSLGIIVDNTVHVITKFQKAINDTNNTEAATAAIYQLAAPALAISSAVFLVGFAILSFSHWGVNSTVALIMLPIFSLSLVTVLVFLPALLAIVESRKIEQTSTTIDQSKSAMEYFQNPRPHERPIKQEATNTAKAQ